MTPTRLIAAQESPGSRPEPSLRLEHCQVFFDFDNTITSFDVLDGIIERFSVNRDWVAYEEAWKKGRIGSRQCLEGQLRSIRVIRPELHAYLETVEIDPSFQKLLGLLHRCALQPVIVSDSFTQIISYILDCNRITGVPVYANSLRMLKDRLLPSFPRSGPDCPRCGHCKTATLASPEFAGRPAVYIGDGLSDLCPARRAALVLAKRGCSLHRALIDTHDNCRPFDDLSEVYYYFKELLDERTVFTPSGPETAPALRG